jgi:hypothetical protein
MTPNHDDDAVPPRRVMYSRTFREQLADFVVQGELTHGTRLAEEKEQLVLDFIDTTLSRAPALKQRYAKLNLVVYPVSNTPFIVIYDFDDAEVRILTCLLKGAGTRLDDFDPASVAW